MIENAQSFICILLFFLAKIYIHYKCSKVPSLKAAQTDLLEVTCAQRLATLYGPMHSFD